MSQNRRDFIRTTTVLSASALPAVKALSETLAKDDDTFEHLIDGNFNSALEFNLIDNNMLNLHFYFVNVSREKGFLIPGSTGHSYMIVRLPQMHLSERGFFDGQDHTDARGYLSGFSYLAFQLWPTIKYPTDAQKANPLLRTMPFEAASFLNWQDEVNLELITLVEWFELTDATVNIFPFQEYIGGEGDFYKKKTFSDAYQSSTSFTPKSRIYAKYRGIVKKFFEDPLEGKLKNKDFVPITLFELPQQLCVVPIYRNKNGKLGTNLNANNFAEKITKSFWINKTVNQAWNNELPKTYEIWNNTLFLRRQEIDPKTNQPEDFTFDIPGLKVMGLITNEKFIYKKRVTACDHINENIPAKNVLPSLLDKVELAYLLQYANGGGDANKNFDDPKFDLKIEDGLFYTGLGAITHIHYKNNDLPEGIDLCEYEHKFSEGRDVFIKVSRMGWNTAKGQPYKHTIEGQRVIELDDKNPDPVQRYKSASFIQFKQYCESLIDGNELTGDDTTWPKFADIDVGDGPGHHYQKNKIIAPAVNNTSSAHFRRFPFTRFENTSEPRIPIDCLQNRVIKRDIEKLECIGWFWPIKENLDYFPDGDSTKDGKPDDQIPSDRYLTCSHNSVDWETKKIPTETRFLFVRKSYVEGRDFTDAYKSYFKGIYAVDGQPQSAFIDRRRTYFNNATIAYTPSSFDSKTNQIETAFIETYFRIRKFPQGTIISNEKFVVVPQVLQAQVFLDHIKDLTLKRLPSYIEYHENYIKGQFQEAQNYGAQILKHTEAFIHSLDADADAAQQTINNHRDELLNSLQQAKDRLGNIVIPDIQPETVSLKKFGITLPTTPDFQQVAGQAERFLDPKRLLPGKFTEIFGGIDLKQILNDYIPESNTPLFQLQKLANNVTDAVEGSRAYQLIEADLNAIRGKIADYKNKYDKAIADVNADKNTITDGLRTISKQIPSAEQVKSLINKQFQLYRTEAFDVLLDTVPVDQVRQTIKNKSDEAQAFLANELAVLKDKIITYQQAIGPYLLEIKAISDQLRTIDPHRLPQELLQLGINRAEDYLTANLQPVYNRATVNFDHFELKLQQLYNTIGEASPIKVTAAAGGTVNVYFDPGTYVVSTSGGTQLMTFSGDISVVGFIQLDAKMDLFKKIILKNTNGDTVQASVAARLQTHISQDLTDRYTAVKALVADFQDMQMGSMAQAITTWKNRWEQFNQTAIDVAGRQNMQKFHDLVLKALPWIDYIRRIDPYLYYQQAIQLEKDAKDIRDRIQSDVLDVYQAYAIGAGGIQDAATRYKNAYIQFIADQDLNKLSQNTAKIDDDLGKVFDKVIAKVADLPGYENIKPIVTSVQTLSATLAQKQQDYLNKLKDYTDFVKTEGGQLEEQLTEVIADFIVKHQDDIALVNDARNIYNLLTNLKQQDLTYNWSTDNFRDVDFGVVSFKALSSPSTRLDVEVRVTTHFTPNKFPPQIASIDTTSINRISNFGIGVFGIFTVIFSEASFSAGTGQSTHFDIKIREVKFDGALAFVQKLEEFLKTLDAGLILDLESDHVALGYSLPIPSIQTPGFAFFNLTLNFDFRLFFDKRPMSLGFSFATAERKFGIAVYIFAGFGFFTIVAEPKRGIVSIDAALEAGAWAGFSLGPIHGEVKLAFGFRYTKGDFGVRIEGYIVAEGRLAIWIIEVSARIYLGVVSQNSAVEGSCVVTYSVKLGFFKKSFSGTFRKRIAGAESSPQQAAVARYNANKASIQQLAKVIDRIEMLQAPVNGALSRHVRAWARVSQEDFVQHHVFTQPDQPVTETYHVTPKDWNQYFSRLKLRKK